jgi:2',3'-cyclic-nucleotide 2'-phosphodiesterase (5'-nucleotidase family)
MRRLILTTCLFSLVLLACGADGDPARSITILHTNGLHARLLPDASNLGGFAHLATAIRSECQDSRGCLVLDGGDLVQGSPVSSIYHGVPIFEIANLLGLDASTLGNHEFDYGWRMIPRFVQKARFPIVNANVVDSHRVPLVDKPYLILERNGVHVGVIGVLTEGLLHLTLADRRG